MLTITHLIKSALTTIAALSCISSFATDTEVEFLTQAETAGAGTLTRDGVRATKVEFRKKVVEGATIILVYPSIVGLDLISEVFKVNKIHFFSKGCRIDLTDGAKLHVTSCSKVQ